MRSGTPRSCLRGRSVRRAKAQERVSMRSPISLLARLVSGTVSSCTCLTKTPDVLQHDPECKYRLLTEAAVAVSKADEPIPMLLFCPECGAQHIDEPDPARGRENPPHRSHLCRECGTIWR